MHYEGSCGIDGDLLDLAGMLENESIDIYNVTNGKRFRTYVIRAESGSGIISLNGAAAHMADLGDIIIICAYARMNEQQANQHKPKLVYCNEDNTVKDTANVIPVQVL